MRRTMSPLDDIRVLDLTRLLPGPFASMLLAELGAKVDKLEDTGAGDYLRNLPPQVDGINALFRALNRGKRSLALNLKDPNAREALLSLLPHYDIVLEQFRPDVLTRLGLAPETLLARKPSLILCSISGYGQTGLLKARAGHDLNYLARGGVLGFQGPSGEPPTVPGFQVADIGGALYAVSGILAALRVRDRSGVGAHLDISMTEAAMGFALSGFAVHLEGAAQASEGAADPRGTTELVGGIAPYRTYETKDGRYVALAALEPKFWLGFCAAVGIEQDASALFLGPHQAAWISRLEALFRSKSFAEWQALSEATDVCLEPVLNPLETLTDPHLTERGVFAKAPDGARVFRSPLRQLADPTVVPQTTEAAVPGHGAHTETILREAGVAEDLIASLVPPKPVEKT